MRVLQRNMLYLQQIALFWKTTIKGRNLSVPKTFARFLIINGESHLLSKLCFANYCFALGLLSSMCALLYLLLKITNNCLPAKIKWLLLCFYLFASFFLFSFFFLSFFFLSFAFFGMAALPLPLLLGDSMPGTSLGLYRNEPLY